MLTYVEKHGFGTVTIEPDNEFYYYIVHDLETNGRFVVRIHAENSNLVDCWCPDEWHNGFELNKMQNVENLNWKLVDKRLSYTLPTKATILAAPNN